jgi:hypothetical protein
VASAGDIFWTTYCKVRQVNVLGGITVIKYDYDAQQNRVFKSIQNFTGTNNTYYVRDIQGNIMVTYTQNGTTFTWAVQHLYGSSRLGLLRLEVSWTFTKNKNITAARLKLADLVERGLCDPSSVIAG